MITCVVLTRCLLSTCLACTAGAIKTHVGTNTSHRAGHLFRAATPAYKPHGYLDRYRKAKHSITWNTFSMCTQSLPLSITSDNITKCRKMHLLYNFDYKPLCVAIPAKKVKLNKQDDQRYRDCIVDIPRITNITFRASDYNCMDSCWVETGVRMNCFVIFPCNTNSCHRRGTNNYLMVSHEIYSRM